MSAKKRALESTTKRLFCPFLIALGSFRQKHIPPASSPFASTTKFSSAWSISSIAQHHAFLHCKVQTSDTWLPLTYGGRVSEANDTVGADTRRCTHIHTHTNIDIQIFYTRTQRHENAHKQTNSHTHIHTHTYTKIRHIARTHIRIGDVGADVTSGGGCGRYTFTIPRIRFVSFRLSHDS
jgi:hypothetical protein